MGKMTCFRCKKWPDHCKCTRSEIDIYRKDIVKRMLEESASKTKFNTKELFKMAIERGRKRKAAAA